MCLLIIIGWIIAGVIWYYFGPVWGVIAVVLFAVTGFGWTLLAGGIGAASMGISALGPKRREFKKAWRELDCEPKLGDYRALEGRLRPRARAGRGRTRPPLYTPPAS